MTSHQVLNSARDYPSTTLSSITHTAQKLRRSRMERLNSKQTIIEQERAQSMMVKKDSNKNKLDKLISTPVTQVQIATSIDTPLIKRTSLKEVIGSHLEKSAQVGKQSTNRQDTRKEKQKLFHQNSV